jgi:hypothetical protein
MTTEQINRISYQSVRHGVCKVQGKALSVSYPERYPNRCFKNVLL